LHILRLEGFSRRGVDRAVEAMVAAGEVDIESRPGMVRVRIGGVREWCMAAVPRTFARIVGAVEVTQTLGAIDTVQRRSR
jgi:hypothetical protein